MGGGVGKVVSLTTEEEGFKTPKIITKYLNETYCAQYYKQYRTSSNEQK